MLTLRREPVTARGRSPRNPKILIVEDDTTTELLFSRILAQIDPAIDYDWVRSVDEAVEELQAERYDLVLSDLILEGTETGLDLWEYCQAERPGTPFVLMSAVSVERFLQLVGKSRVCPFFLPKSLFPGECRQVISAFLGRD